MSEVNAKQQTNDENHDSIENHTEQRPKVRSQISMVELDRMVAESLKDVDVDVDDDDDDDPALLNELSQIIHPENVQESPEKKTKSSVHEGDAVPAFLKERIEMYKIAEANANAANESSRARRFGRGLSTLESMLIDALEGKTVNIEDIPPEVITGEKDSASKVQQSNVGGTSE